MNKLTVNLTILYLFSRIEEEDWPEILGSLALSPQNLLQQEDTLRWLTEGT